jgi:hypothetical protein
VYPLDWRGPKQEPAFTGLNYDIFENVRPPDPTQPHAVYYATELDFRIKPAAKAVDAGTVLPNINDGFAGKAPDLGAYEAGQTIPIYGPRSAIRHPFYR